ncbi:hypothetical protein D3C78_1760220 [compost metagenome]
MQRKSDLLARAAIQRADIPLLALFDGSEDRQVAVTLRMLGAGIGLGRFFGVFARKRAKAVST